MEVKIISEGMKSDWENYVHNNPYSIAWQSYEWSNVLKMHYDIDFYPLAAYDKLNICGVFPLYKVKTLLGKDKLISVPFAVAGGIVADSEEASSALLNAGISISEKFNRCSITLKQYKIKVNGDLTTDDNYYNRELSLSKGADHIWKDLADKNKEMIERSKGYELSIDYPSNDLYNFYELLSKYQHMTGIPTVGFKWIKSLIDFKMYSIAILKNRGTIVAGTMIKEFKDTISFPFTCLTDTNEKAQIFAYALYWELMKKFAYEGKKIFHSGRIHNNAHTGEFRLGWGGEKYAYYYQYYPKTVTETESGKRRGSKRMLLEASWKRMPQAIARLLGPYIVRHFP